MQYCRVAFCLQRQIIFLWTWIFYHNVRYLHHLKRFKQCVTYTFQIRHHQYSNNCFVLSDKMQTVTIPFYKWQKTKHLFSSYANAFLLLLPWLLLNTTFCISSILLLMMHCGKVPTVAFTCIDDITHITNIYFDCCYSFLHIRLTFNVLIIEYAKKYPSALCLYWNIDLIQICMLSSTSVDVV